MKIRILIYLLFITIISWGQIPVRTISEPSNKVKTETVIPSYDSLQNIYMSEELNECKKFVNQRLYLSDWSNQIFLFTINENLIKLENEKNDDFYYNNFISYIYKPEIPLKLGKGSSLVVSEHNKSSIFNKYFKVIDVISNEDIINRGKLTQKKYDKDSYVYRKTFKSNPFAFLLIEETSGDTVFCYNPKNFIVVGYFEKLQKTFKNNFFVNTKNEYSSNDINSGNKVEIASNSKWLCSDISLIEKKDKSGSELFIILQKSGSEIAINAKEIEKNYPYRNWISEIEIQNEKMIENQKLIAEKKLKEKEAYENRIKQQKLKEEERIEKEKYTKECISKYGQHYGTLIANNKVEVGMNTEHCKKAWGNPSQTKKVTETNGTSEIWFYEKSTTYFLTKTKLLYFKNGILKRIEEQN